MSDRPNILLVHSDQHRYDCVGANGHPFVETPNLDQLAAEGVNFDNAFTPIPLCTPARACLLTGRWSTSHLGLTNFHQGHGNPRPMLDGLRTFSEVLSGKGYDMGYVGKWHVHPDRSPLAYGFDHYVPAGDYARWRRDQGLPEWPSDAGHPGCFGNTDLHIEPSESRLAWGADNVIEQIETYARDDDPFFLRWDPPEPHFPNVPPEPYASMYDPDEIAPWENYADDLQDKPYVQEQQRRSWRVDDFDWDDWAEILSRYLGEISLLDAQIGRLLETLDEQGIAGNTLVIYTSDHGDMGGSHGMFDKQCVMYDELVHVPLIARWPAGIQREAAVESFVSNELDLAATFCDAAGVEVPSEFQGESLVPFFEDPSHDGRDDIVSVYHGNTSGLYSERMLRTDRWKYVWNATAVDELYDLEADPGELENLARDPDHREQLSAMRDRLLAWMEETNDTILNRWTRAQLADDVKK